MFQLIFSLGRSFYFASRKMAAGALPTPSTSTRASFSDSTLFSQLQFHSPRPQTLIQKPWLLGITTPTITNKLRAQYSALKPLIVPKHPPINATVVFSLPTAKPERAFSAEAAVPKWSSKAIKSFAMAELEARKLKYPATGTEALIMGILIEGTNFASKFLRANGITLLKVREETAKLLGKADMYFFSPEHPPLTEEAQRALDWAVDEKLKTGKDGEITTTHLLLGVWAEEESPGHKILATLGCSNEKAKELASVISEPGSLDD